MSTAHAFTHTSSPAPGSSRLPAVWPPLRDCPLFPPQPAALPELVGLPLVKNFIVMEWTKIFLCFSHLPFGRAIQPVLTILLLQPRRLPSLQRSPWRAWLCGALLHEGITGYSFVPLVMEHRVAPQFGCPNGCHYKHSFAHPRALTFSREENWGHGGAQLQPF